MPPDTSTAVTIADEQLILDRSGAGWWPGAATLIVADLHLEKGSAYAGRGAFLPPYDTRSTVRRLAGLVERYRPARILCLGDSFHDGDAGGRIDPEDARALRALAAGRDWVWIAGNHDPEPPSDLGGTVCAELAEAGLVFRHQAVAAEPGNLTRGGESRAAEPRSGEPRGGELSGHFHPKALVRAHGKRIWRSCFVEDGVRLVLPAFGAYTGGLDVTDRAFAGLFPDGFTAHLLGRDRLFSFASTSAAFA